MGPTGRPWSGRHRAPASRRPSRSERRQFPLSSLADDVARLRQVLEFQDGPTVVVGHSYGGQIMDGARQRCDETSSDSSYVAAFGLDEGEIARRPALPRGTVNPRLWRNLFHPMARAASGWLSRRRLRQSLRGRRRPQTQAKGAVCRPAVLSPPRHSRNVMGTPAWKSACHPGILITQDDEALPPHAQATARRANGNATNR